MRLFLLITLLALFCAPVLAQEAEPIIDEEPSSLMECLTPSLPPAGVGAGTVGGVTAGANSLGTYVQDWEIYLTCISNKAVRKANELCQSVIDKSAAALQNMKSEK